MVSSRGKRQVTMRYRVACIRSGRKARHARRRASAGVLPSLKEAWRWGCRRMGLKGRTCRHGGPPRLHGGGEECRDFEGDCVVLCLEGARAGLGTQGPGPTAELVVLHHRGCGIHGRDEKLHESLPVDNVELSSAVCDAGRVSPQGRAGDGALRSAWVHTPSFESTEHADVHPRDRTIAPSNSHLGRSSGLIRCPGCRMRGFRRTWAPHSRPKGGGKTGRGTGTPEWMETGNLQLFATARLLP